MSVAAPAWTPAMPLEQTFELHSRRSASKTIYLDFTGHTTIGTLWNDARTGSSRIVTPAYDTDGDPSRFSQAELRNIQQVWQMVAEDFSPFDVNVTTQEPDSVHDLIKSNDGVDDRWGIRVVIGGDNRWLGASAGGVAYLTSFNWASDTPTFVFSKDLGGGLPKLLAEAASHEIGHTLGLSHDGEYPDDTFGTYYRGHGSGATGWAPIMGVGYSQQLVQWSKGEYATANNKQDDLAIITTDNGFGYRPDDHGNDAATASVIDPATAVPVAGTDLVTATISGVIERSTDVDVFEFTTRDTATATISPAAISPNLDVLARLWDSSGLLLYTFNPRDALDASFDLVVPAGTYLLGVEGTGKADVYGGYSDYASLGQYTVTMTFNPMDGGYEGPEVSVEGPATPFDEGNAGFTTAIITVRLSAPAHRVVRVSYATADESATTSGGDYEAASGVLEFAPGEVEKQVEVRILGDTIGEETESFSFRISSPVNASLGEVTTAEAFIRDDDAPTITIQDASVTEGDAGDVIMRFRLGLTRADAKNVSVSFATADGTATAGSDYVARQGKVVFRPGQVEKFIDVRVRSDTIGERTETFELRLVTPVNATVMRPVAVGTIFDDDKPAIRIRGGVVAEPGSSGSAFAEFVVSLTSAPDAPVTLRYSTANGTAEARKDYMPVSGTLAFRPNRTQAVVRVPILRDVLVEGDESFFLVITDARGVTLDADHDRATFTIVDDDRREITIAGPNGPVLEGGDAIFTVRLSEESPLPITVSYKTSDESARFTRGDYRAVQGVLRFAPGETEKTIRVPTFADTATEPAERFVMRLASPAGGIVRKGGGEAKATIIDPLALHRMVPEADVSAAAVAVVNVGFVHAAPTPAAVPDRPLASRALGSSIVAAAFSSEPLAAAATVQTAVLQEFGNPTAGSRRKAAMRFEALGLESFPGKAVELACLGFEPDRVRR